MELEEDGAAGDLHMTDGGMEDSIGMTDSVSGRNINGIEGNDLVAEGRSFIQEKLDKGPVFLESHSFQETFLLGEKLGGDCMPGQVYSLIGDLGTGKTVFTQGFARGLGISGPVNSPTFTIQQIYEDGRLPFYHFDVYRIADIEEMEEIGYEDCFYGEGVCLIEWGNLIREILPEHHVQITIEKDLEKGFDYRRIVLERT